MPEKASVIGAAIAGPSAALMLARAGYSVTVYDQRPAGQLYSAGIVGITHSNWTAMEAMGVDIWRHELGDAFEDYNQRALVLSPFRYITWTGLHSCLVEAAQNAGARFVYERHIHAPENQHGRIIDATGVAGAARKMLPHRYSGFTIYRGLSPEHIASDFLTYRMSPAGYLTIGDTPQGAFWAMFAPRPEPSMLVTKTVKVPPHEYQALPAELQSYVLTTPQIAASPMSDWMTPPRMTDGQYVSVGDVNGAVRPVTTSGANLAWMEGSQVLQLMAGDAGKERDLLQRRAYDLHLGTFLESPEIGGLLEDTLFSMHHAMLFGGGYE